MEVAPESRKGTLFDLTHISLKPGIIPAGLILASLLPENIAEYWKNAKSFHLVLFDNPQSINPKTLLRGKQVADLVKNIQPDIIYFEDTSLRVALGSSVLPKATWVTGVHDPAPHLGESNWRTSLSRKLMYGKTKQFILHNEAQRKDFVENYRISYGATSVIRLGIYDVYYDLASKSSGPKNNNILFFGRISPYKGLKVLFDAAEHVSKQVKNVTFTVVGKPIPGYQIPQMPVLLNGGKFDIHLEYVSATMLGNYFHQATCVVCPYLDATQSGVVLTAYAFNKPVIATRTGGMPEYVKDMQTGLLVEPSDPDALADAIVLLLEDQHLLAIMENWITFMQKNDLNWGTISNQYVAVFKSVIKNDNH
jgi:glycosyltransferase involved in cell wall biosynthesis